MFDLFLEDFPNFFFNALEQLRQKCQLGKKLSKEKRGTGHNLCTKEAAVEGPS